MTNEEMMIILERALLIPVKESDAAYILAIVEERLRNESRPTLRGSDGACWCVCREPISNYGICSKCGRTVPPRRTR